MRAHVNCFVSINLIYWIKETRPQPLCVRERTTERCGREVRGSIEASTRFYAVNELRTFYNKLHREQASRIRDAIRYMRTKQRTKKKRHKENASSIALTQTRRKARIKHQSTSSSNGSARCCCFSHNELNSRLALWAMWAEEREEHNPNRHNILRIYIQGWILDPWGLAKAKRRCSIESQSMGTIHQLNLSHFVLVAFDSDLCLVRVRESVWQQQWIHSDGVTPQSYSRAGKMKKRNPNIGWNRGKSEK